MGTCVSAPVSSNKQSTIPSAAPDATAKFVPASETVAPSGKWLPGSVPVAGTAGVVEGADGGAVVAVEVFAEDQVVVPGGVGLQELGAAEAGPPAVGPAGEDRDQPVLQVGGDLIQGQLGA